MLRKPMHNFTGGKEQLREMIQHCISRGRIPRR